MGKVLELAECLSANKEQKILAILDNGFSGKEDPLVILKAVFLGCKTGINDNIRYDVFDYCIKFMQKNDINKKNLSAIIGILLLEVDNCPKDVLIKLPSLFLDAIKTSGANNGRYWEIFAKILMTIDALKPLTTKEDVIIGPDYNDQILKSLCQKKWNNYAALQLVSTIRDVPISSDNLKSIIQKTFMMFPDVELEEVPPFVYQLLLLSVKGQKLLVIEGIVDFFRKLDEKYRNCADSIGQNVMEDFSVDQLRQVEGTVILHITFSTRQDQGLGNEILKYLKNVRAGGSLCPFLVALVMSMARIHRYEKQVLDCLKSTVMLSFKESERNNSWWIVEMNTPSTDITDCMLETVKHVQFGWEDVANGLVQLGFILMDNVAAKTSCNVSLPLRQSCELGAAVLKQIYKLQSNCREEVLQQILHRVISMFSVTKYLDLLADIVRSMPQILTDFLPRISEAVDCLHVIPVSAAVHFLTAIQPLLRINIRLKESLLLVLQKSLFSRNSDIQEFAIKGYVVILNHAVTSGEKLSSQASQSLPLSQSTVDIHIPRSLSENEGSLLEILGKMRKCLQQQARIRQIVYEVFYDVVERNNQVQIPVLHILFSQFQEIYEPCEDINPPIKINKCIKIKGNSVCVIEPLPNLINSIVLCLLTVKNTQSNDVTKKFHDFIYSLTRRILKSELEDFELDKSVDFNENGVNGEKNMVLVMILMGVYESLMTYHFLAGLSSADSKETLLKLFANYENLYEIWLEKTTKDKNNAKQLKSILTMDCASKLLHQLFLESSNFNSDITAFQSYIMRVMVQMLKQVSEHGKCSADKSRIYKICCSVSRDLFLIYSSNMESVCDKKVAAQLSRSCITGLDYCFQIICNCYKSQIVEFLASIGFQSICVDKPAIGEVHEQNRTQKIQVWLEEKIKDCDRNSIQDILPFLRVIDALVTFNQIDSTGMKHLQIWLQNLCAVSEIDNCDVVYALVSLLLKTTKRVKSCNSLLNKLSQDIHLQLGDIEQDVNLESMPNLKLINKKVINNSFFLMVMSQFDDELDNAVWYLSKIKAKVSDDTERSEQRRNQENRICSKFGALISSFHELVQTALPVGACFHSLIKQLTKIYNGLSVLVKYYLHGYNKGTGYYSEGFQEVVKMSGNFLTSHVYSMISYFETSIKQEGTLIPRLIYSIEQYEKFLIQLSKKAKINLMEHMKLSVSRDFRINVNAFQEKEPTAEMDDGSNEDEDGNDGDDDNDGDDPEVGASNVNEDKNDENFSLIDAGKETDNGLDKEPPPKRKRLGKRK